MNKMLKYLFFGVIVRFIIMIVIGLNIRHHKKLPEKGPAIIVANHNSHLDTLVLMTLFQKKLLSRIHPVAAADYFLTTKLMTWFSTQIMGIIPITRQGTKEKTIDPLEPCYQALERNDILIIFPEGTRGQPEHLCEFKKGISYLAEKYPTVPVIPIFMHGLGKALPKGEYLLVPFFCDVFIGDAIYWSGCQEKFMKQVNQSVEHLALEGDFREWN